MAQHDMNIANQGFPATRADLNNALQALVSNSSGTSAPSTTFANQWWYDTTNNKMYLRNEANNAWIEVFTLDQTNNEWQLTTGVIQAKDSDGLALKTDDGTTRLFIKDSDGSIGLGTSSPSQKLHVEGAGNQFIFLNNSSTGDSFNFKAGTGASSIQTNGGSHIMNFFTSGTERLRILAGGGLTFNGDTAAANALSDYEEGSFTPTYTADSGTITTGSNAGKYVKVGDMVHCHFRIRSTAVSSISGAISISGFPFAPVADGRSAGSKWFARDWGTDMPNFSFGVVAGQTYAALYKQAMNASSSSVSNFNFGTGSDDNVLEASITYQVA